MNKDINAIGIVKQMVADGQISQDVAEKYFPELAESEDERIRKNCIEYIKASCLDIDELNECIAWLEKQSESTEINPSEFDSQLNSLLKKFESLPKEELAGVLNFYLNVVRNDGTYKEEKQGEQKPVPKFRAGDVVRSSNGASLLIVGITDYCYNCVTCATNDEYSFGFDIQDEFELVEQKPWSEEDEYLLDETIKHLESLIRITKKQGSAYSDEIQYYQRDIDWLKSLKDRVQPKQQWSKEDERIKNNLLSELTNLSVRKLIEKETENKYVNWLKSLRPQNWKPSKEQMNTLEYYMHTLVCNEYKEILFGLYADLKKLMEE